MRSEEIDQSAYSPSSTFAVCRMTIFAIDKTADLISH